MSTEATPGSAPYAPPAGDQYAGSGTGPVGKVRGTGLVIVLTIVTFGIYSLYWYYKIHQEMKAHSGAGIGGPIALLLAFFVGFVMPFISSHEIGSLRERAGQEPKVSAVTGLWVIPGCLLLVLPLVWLVKTNGAINDYWRSLGAA
ncbi:DUF4234 domain-containing protein [Nocardioides daphniae]|uniref:DUF4234 domain-containing protein n=1 Tax=Nocardioides daphniae TaxID=402297 RepID=A0A4P7UGW2_9ACTN|nr:DUF4234 domain-containing protein [Nocardioides daphniae]QCC78458.1 DUF4234 domain-containing protein [Nocardioides daphniae]GGD12240.1 hypothetical protein GCM10007231_09010 [Nocardioides daphniae]